MMMEATHSMRSCPYWCSISEALCDIFMPAITIRLLKISEAESTASETRAAEWPKMPAANLEAARNTLRAMPFFTVLRARA